MVGIGHTLHVKKSDNLINTEKRFAMVWNIASVPPLPGHKLSKTRSITLDYRGRTSAPSMTQLQPVARHVQPFAYCSRGNLQSLTHRSPTMFVSASRTSMPTHSAHIMAMADAQVVQNAIVTARPHSTSRPAVSRPYICQC